MQHYINIEVHMDKHEILESIFKIDSEIVDTKLTQTTDSFVLRYKDGVKKTVTISNRDFVNYLKRFLNAKKIMSYHFREQAFDTMTIMYSIDLDDLGRFI